MATCKLKASVGKQKCDYSVAGCRALYLANFYPINPSDEASDKFITYTRDADGRITKIELPTGEKFFACVGNDNSISFTDVLTVNGSAKSRTHTVNAQVSQYDEDILENGDAISLGRFIAIIVDTAGRVVVMGRTSGLTATSFNYNSGAATTDASGWETVLEGVSTEIAPLLLSEAVIDPLFEEVIEP